MKSIVKKIQILFVACATVSSLASSVVEDSKKHFILDDVVLNSSAESCEDGTGMRFSPENAFYKDSNAVPVRYYRIALPSNAKPTVSVTDSKVVPLGGPLCKSTPAKSLPVAVSEPYLKDNLWQADVQVPLYLVRGQSVSLRQNFRLKVDFASSSVSGRNPGARALMLVENAKSAAQFGVAAANNSVLRREASSDFDGIVQLVQLVVGDKNMASFTEDGMYAVDFKAVRNSLLKVMRQSELDGIPIEKLCLYGASPDTLPDMAPRAK